MNTQTSPEIDVIEVLDESIADVKLWSLVVFNDDVNTFDHVIDTLIEICEHNPQQAEQCALIIHFKGKCGVKSGDQEELITMRNAICDRGISAEVMLK
ncbi:ATP-dependent Clp protease adaptor protein ClpS [Spirosomataceae bacterium TFI 002]|nr:ATP-dependent Clp protease adaptor protein ClpS [Spirosomataceae bacterium TFI 002]